MLSRISALSALIAAPILAACVPSEPEVDWEAQRLLNGNEELQACIETQCTTLNLDGNALEDFSVLASMPHVKSLMVSRTNITDLNDIAGMTQLKELHIAWTQIDDLTPLSNFTNLDVLHVTGMGSVDSWAPVHQVKGLRELAVDADPVTGLGFIASMPTIETLYVGDGEIKDLSPLAFHPRLKHLSINSAFNADPAPLLQMPALRRVTFDWFELDADTTRLLEGKGVEIDQVPMIVC